MYGFIESFQIITGSEQYDLVSLEALKAALGVTDTSEETTCFW